MDRFVGSIYIQPIRVLWVSEIFLSGLNLFPPFNEGLHKATCHITRTPLILISPVSFCNLHFSVVLFDGDAFSQISGLIHIRSFQIGHIIGQKLKRDGQEDRSKGGMGLRNENDVIGLL